MTPRRVRTTGQVRTTYYIQTTTAIRDSAYLAAAARVRRQSEILVGRAAARPARVREPACSSLVAADNYTGAIKVQTTHT